MTISADLAECSIRAKRWAKAACESGLVQGGANPEVRHSALYSVGSRWRIYEQLKWANLLPDTNLPDDSTIKQTECCVASAPTWGELLHKYAMWAVDENRVAYFRDRELRGESQHVPPPDPPEWRVHREEMMRAAAEAGERNAEWVKRSARGQMERLGLLDPVKFELAWRRAESMGLVHK